MLQTTKYLKDSPSGLQTAENVQECLKALLPFKLTKAEKLMIINNAPRTPVEIQVVRSSWFLIMQHLCNCSPFQSFFLQMIDDCDDRFTEEETQNLLDIVARTLPLPEIELETG